MILTDTMIQTLGLVTPSDVPEPVPCPTSRGLSSCGYDVSYDANTLRVGHRGGGVPYMSRDVRGMEALLQDCAQRFSPRAVHQLENGTLYTPLYSGEFALCAVNERIKLPRNIMARIFPKSTLVRVGLRLEQTIAEPGWEGRLTLEIYNQSLGTIYLLHGMGIAQLTFEQLTGDVACSYSDKNGKYQGDDNVQYAKMFNPTVNRE